MLSVTRCTSCRTIILVRREVLEYKLFSPAGNTSLKDAHMGAHCRGIHTARRRTERISVCLCLVESHSQPKCPNTAPLDTPTGQSKPTRTKVHPVLSRHWLDIGGIELSHPSSPEALLSRARNILPTKPSAIIWPTS